MVEKPPLHTYDISLEVEAHGGYGGIWRPFYLSYIYIIQYKDTTKIYICCMAKSAISEHSYLCARNRTNM